MSEQESNQLTRIIEGALFAYGEPLTMDRILELFEPKERPEKKEIKEALDAIAEIYAERGIELKELASGFQFQVKQDLAQWVKRLWEEKPAKYSRALLETLALIAYRQPITRAEIEEIRGVCVSSYMIKTLMDRDWIKIVGHKDVPGKPGLFATTKEFLDHFGLKNLSDLPPLSEIQSLMPKEEEREEPEEIQEQVKELSIDPEEEESNEDEVNVESEDDENSGINQKDENEPESDTSEDFDEEFENNQEDEDDFESDLDDDDNIELDYDKNQEDESEYDDSTLTD